MSRVVIAAVARAQSRKLRVVAIAAAVANAQLELAAMASFVKVVLERNAMAAQPKRQHWLAQPRHANPHAVARNRVG